MGTQNLLLVSVGKVFEFAGTVKWDISILQEGAEITKVILLGLFLILSILLVG